jgi:hypothetical protein
MNDSKQLLKRIEELEYYLTKALEDIHTCARSAKGFLQVCEPINVRMYYESDIVNQLEGKELKFVQKHNLPTIVQTHPYSVGIWKWRYEDDVQKLLKEEIPCD